MGAPSWVLQLLVIRGGGTATSVVPTTPKRPELASLDGSSRLVEDTKLVLQQLGGRRAADLLGPADRRAGSSTC
jgi:hypothetical protein